MQPKINILHSEVKDLNSQGLQLRKVENILNGQMELFYAYGWHENNKLGANNTYS